MVWVGLIFGLFVFQLLRAWPESAPLAPTSAAAPADPFREARRSRAILEAQEGAPSPLPARSGRMIQPGDVWVIDGDTFSYGGTRIRIADIDTPEVHGRCAYEIQLAARATARLRTLLAEGPFELHSLGYRDVDRYGRKLRIVTRHGRSLGDRLVSEGLARTWTGRREPWC